jgi:hypothetical protein
MYAVCKARFSVRDRRAAAAMEVLRGREYRPVVIIAVSTPLFVRDRALGVGTVSVARESRSVCA